jgi:hypothetical protein
MTKDDVTTMLTLLKLKTVFVHHFDEWRKSYSEEFLESNLGRAQRFSRDVNSIDERIKVIVPEFFESYTHQ